MKVAIWSEYKVTFAKTNTLLDFLFSKGYYPSEMNSKHFTFDQFQNYKSSDLETSHIGFLNHSKQIIYMAEERFDAINQELSDVAVDMFDYVFTKQNKGQEQDTVVILKRGISLRFMGSHFRFRIDTRSFRIDFDSLRGDEKMCRLDLVKIIEDERMGWIAPVTPVTPEAPVTPVTPVDIQSVVKIENKIIDISEVIDIQSVQIIQINDNFHEYELFFNNKFIQLENKIKELSEHNKQLSYRLSVFENPSPLQPPIILF
jgi:hypothetical protein